ncbi:NADH-quinone oxidoreductase subunit L [Sulfurovum sp. ST-21]|uniref:NADH-quinone oxidoreductase subunit L n=1 Tax=Sulfurovum indicum TaxID=2779528 RepID=A0A7M1S4K7_9BACT|nr:NADH-quinone oxidoreductase subunit L [Sulfurovum indicum]QOR62124.1 NADH-quinone oxidoreductase subunit L [Sulfurovum indicum]
MEGLVYIALFAPFASSLFAALFGMSERKIFVGIVASVLLAVSFIASAMLAFYVYTTGDAVHVTMMDWINAGDLRIPFGFVVDQVSVTMMTVVTLVSTIVHIYSIGYMDHDKSFNRFFSYLSAFVFSMMVLVMSDNFAGLFIGWEGVGVCSWLLVGFWYHKPDQSREENPSISPSWAANEAFIMNRIADLGMLIGIFIIYWNVGSLQYDVVFAALPNLSGSILNAAAIALFIGAMGKSAQFPLHTWLTDAMEGPTPVSALIHAATMVTAGVFLVIRANPLFSMTPEVSYFIASLGTFVAFFAASMALVNRDLKRIIAFSTLSQLGYMFAAAGLGAYWIALFHLAAHAFFKALLFLGAGNVMHAMHDELDIFKMGGLKKVMKWSYIYMGLASLALAGIPFFAGFFSKDAIIETAWNEGTIVLWAILVVTAGMTAFYSFRQVFLTFHGDERYKAFGIHPHEMYKFVLIAMSPLAVLAVVAGFGMGGFEHFVTKLLPEYHMSEHTHHIAWILGLVVLVFAVGGIALAYKKYANGLKRDEKLESSWYYKLLANQYYIPNLYEEFISKPYAMISEMMWSKVDMKIVDATVDGIAKILYKTGDGSRKMQTGNLSNYLNWMAVGAVLLLVVAAISAAMLG